MNLLARTSSIVSVMSQWLLVGPPEKTFTRGASYEVVIEVEGNDTEVVISVDLDNPGPSPSVKQVLLAWSGL